MAIKTLSFVSLILRPYVRQTISVEGWKFLLSYADPTRNFDGELMAFGAMSGAEIDTLIRRLTDFGYVGPDKGNASDMVVSDMFSSMEILPDWIELVDVEFFNDKIPPVKAWKLRDSGVYDLIDFEVNFSLPRKGYQCDWRPLIGKIGD